MASTSAPTVLQTKFMASQAALAKEFNDVTHWIQEIYRPLQLKVKTLPDGPDKSVKTKELKLMELEYERRRLACLGVESMSMFLSSDLAFQWFFFVETFKALQAQVLQELSEVQSSAAQPSSEQQQAPVTPAATPRLPSASVATPHTPVASVATPRPPRTPAATLRAPATPVATPSTQKARIPAYNNITTASILPSKGHSTTRNAVLPASPSSHTFEAEGSPSPSKALAILSAPVSDTPMEAQITTSHAVGAVIKGLKGNLDTTNNPSAPSDEPLRSIVAGLGDRLEGLGGRLGNCVEDQLKSLNSSTNEIKTQSEENNSIIRELLIQSKETNKYMKEQSKQIKNSDAGMQELGTNLDNIKNEVISMNANISSAPPLAKNIKNLTTAVTNLLGHLQS